jgi:hypothetical protein
MPADSRVHVMYQALLREGNDPATAARIAQAKTGLALRTGRPPMRKSVKLKKGRYG